MGIFPYFTPEELEKINQIRTLEDIFLSERGYVKCCTVNKLGYFSYPFSIKAPNGKIYSNEEEFYKEIGWYPHLMDKDGTCWSKHEALKREGFISPYYDENAFLISKGYKEHEYLTKDYVHNIKLLELHYRNFGFVPRWYNKNSIAIGHEQALTLEGYQYPFGKSDAENLAVLEKYNHPCG